MADAKKPGITEIRKRKFAHQIGVDIPDETGVVADGFFKNYSNDQSYEDVFEHAFNGKYVVDLIDVIWAPKLPYKLLDCGSANGLTLAHFEEFGIEAWGIENSVFIHSKTPEEWRERNLLGDVRKMPFEDGAFDFLYVTCLPHMPAEIIDEAIKEMFRVCRTGVVLQGVTVDMTEEVIEDYELFAGLQTFWTFSEWADAMLRAGFELAISTPAMLDEVWRIERETDLEDWDWYPGKDEMRYSFLSKPKTKRNP